MRYTIGRDVNGVSLNGREFLLDEEDNVIELTEKEVLSTLKLESLEEGADKGYYIEEVLHVVG